VGPLVPVEEDLAHGFGGLAVGILDGISVDAKSDPRIAVSEPSLRGLHVDASSNHGRRIRPSQVMKARA